ncbi:MAG TPA: hypothetical protein VM347_21285 [Nonomuraea sp.]|nr:hypothetical protein [Nonomuraea sp.]
MTTVFTGSTMNDDARRQRIFQGDVFVYAASPASRELVSLARELVAETFGGMDPTTAQHSLPVERFAALLADVKPRFIHHPRCKEIIAVLLDELGFAPGETYFDVPRLRTSTSDGYLDSGISYAYHAHRDCWYAAPFNQVNWWIPVYDVVPENVFALHPEYFDRAVRNGSGRYDYASWVRTERPSAAQHIYSDTREQPKPEEDLDLSGELRIVTEPGGVLLFSGAQLHSTVRNTSGVTRFSIDFRTVHIDDVKSHKGAPNVDATCLGTTLRDFMRAKDLARVPEELSAEYEKEARAHLERATAVKADISH